jgi:hypothetical protein
MTWYGDDYEKCCNPAEMIGASESKSPRARVGHIGWTRYTLGRCALRELEQHNLAVTQVSKS